MIQIELIRNYFPVQIRDNSIFNKYFLKEYIQLLILDYLSSTPYIRKMTLIGGTNLRLVVYCNLKVYQSAAKKCTM